jgi:DNA-binding FadR family transcriptional regulator
MTNLVSAALRGGYPRKRNLFSHVVEELGRRIMRGDVLPGETLPNEAALGAEFDASRSVIREAVKSLAAKGLIESRTRTGIHVLSPVHWNLLDPEVLAWRYSAMPPAQFFGEIFEVRGLIEPNAAALAAERATDDEIAAMASAYAAMEAAEEPGPAAIEADLHFHRSILAGAHNDLLLQMGSLIGVGLMVSYRLSSDSYSRFRPMHRDVLDAIEARDAQGAREAMARLLTETRAFLETRLSRSRRSVRPSRPTKARRTMARAPA